MEAEPLLCLLHQRGYVHCPCDILGDECTQKFDYLYHSVSSTLYFLKSMISSFFEVLSARLLMEHSSVSFWTSAL